jgi:hypothetical protein
MGGLALAAWNHVRATRDVDLLVSLGKADLDLVLTKLGEKGVRPRTGTALDQIGNLRMLQLVYDPPGAFLDVSIDLILADCDHQRQAIERSVRAQLPGLDVEILVLSCEDLIINKLVAGRILDGFDASSLLRANRSTLDMKYLQLWIARLELMARWRAAWREAFPEEEQPFA